MDLVEPGICQWKQDIKGKECKPGIVICPASVIYAFTVYIEEHMGKRCDQNGYKRYKIWKRYYKPGCPSYALTLTCHSYSEYSKRPYLHDIRNIIYDVDKIMYSY